MLLPYDRPWLPGLVLTPAHEPTDRHGTPDRPGPTKKKDGGRDPKGPSKPKSERKPDTGRRSPSKKGPSRHKSAPASPEQGDPTGVTDHRNIRSAPCRTERGATR